jgi:hypothetical protein
MGFAGMHFVCDRVPGLNMFFIKETRNACITEAVRGGGSAFGDDQTSFGTLPVIFGDEMVGYIIHGAIACHRSHDNTVFKCERSKFVGIKKDSLWHTISFVDGNIDLGE